MKTTHTHRGTCQACGSHQAVDNVSGLIAKHGYKVIYGSFQYVCDAAGYKPAEHDVTHTRETIVRCINAAESNEANARRFRSGEIVPPLFKRWNPKKEKIERTRSGGERKTLGDYEVLAISKATPEERANRINEVVAEAETNAAGFRGHAAFLTREVLPRLGQPLYVNEALALRALVKGLTFTHEGHTYELTRPAYSSWGRRLMGWYVCRVPYDAARELRWTTKEIRAAMNPKPVVAEGGYKTKVARKADLDKLNRVFDAKRQAIQQMYLDLPRGQRTEAKTEIYYGCSQLSNWRPKHSAAVLKEFPAATPIVQDIEALVAERLRIKAAPGV